MVNNIHKEAFEFINNSIQKNRPGINHNVGLNWGFLILITGTSPCCNQNFHSRPFKEFTAVSQVASVFIANGNVKDMKLITNAGKEKLVVVAINDAYVKVFQIEWNGVCTMHTYFYCRERRN